MNKAGGRGGAGAETRKRDGERRNMITPIEPGARGKCEPGACRSEKQTRSGIHYSKRKAKTPDAGLRALNTAVNAAPMHESKGRVKAIGVGSVGPLRCVAGWMHAVRKWWSSTRQVFSVALAVTLSLASQTLTLCIFWRMLWSSRETLTYMCTYIYRCSKGLGGGSHVMQRVFEGGLVDLFIYFDSFPLLCETKWKLISLWYFSLATFSLFLGDWENEIDICTYIHTYVCKLAPKEWKEKALCLFIPLSLSLSLGGWFWVLLILWLLLRDNEKV